MKKIILLFFTTSLLVSCAVPRKAYVRESSAVDFSEYARKGFFITESNSVSFPYEPISSVSALVESGYEVLGEKRSASDELYGLNLNTKYGEFIRAKSQDALDELYEKSREMGADGIINLKIDYTPLRTSSNGSVISWESYYITGMAIKRK